MVSPLRLQRADSRFARFQILAAQSAYQCGNALPETRTMPTAPRPGAVAMAAIGSLWRGQHGQTFKDRGRREIIALPCMRRQAWGHDHLLIDAQQSQQFDLKCCTATSFLIAHGLQSKARFLYLQW